MHQTFDPTILFFTPTSGRARTVAMAAASRAAGMTGDDKLHVLAARGTG